MINISYRYTQTNITNLSVLPFCIVNQKIRQIEVTENQINQQKVIISLSFFNSFFQIFVGPHLSATIKKIEDKLLRKSKYQIKYNENSNKLKKHFKHIYLLINQLNNQKKLTPANKQTNIQN
ncbi:hypothetical protein ABPG74_010199 [Tetrahymena malaccensis]